MSRAHPDKILNAPRARLDVVPPQPAPSTLVSSGVVVSGGASASSNPAANPALPSPFAPVPGQSVATSNPAIVSPPTGSERQHPTIVPIVKTTFAERLSRGDAEKLNQISEWREQDLQDTPGFVETARRFFSGFASSLIVHTLLLVLLALLTYSFHESEIIELTMLEPDGVSIEAPLVDIDIDLTPLNEIPQAELEDETIQDLSDELLPDRLDAQFVDVSLEDVGFEGLASEGLGSGIGDGGSSSGGSQAVPGESAGFFGTYAKGKNFVFVIDCSGSMMGERWRRAVYELERSIEELDEDQKFCIVLYNHHAQIMQNARRIKMRVANDENRARAFHWLESQIPMGGTYPRKAMVFSLRAEPDAIFLLSDGEIQDNTREFLAANNRDFSHGSGHYGRIPVHTIALLSLHGQRHLKAIADENEGTFTRVGQ